MNAKAAHCDRPTAKKKRGMDDVPFAASGYTSMEDEGSDRGENSDDLFSDCEEKRDIAYYSPNLSHVSDSTISNLSASSLLHSNHQYSTPAAVVPSTPLPLLPFLTKVNEQWTSDLETPQADKTAGARMNQSAVSLDSGEKGVSRKQCTPPVSCIKSMESEVIIGSPVINCKRVRNRTKRRIFLSTTLASPPGSILSVSNETAKENDIKHGSRCTEENVTCQDSNDVNACVMTSLLGNDVSKSISTSPAVKCHNTSTQDFFINASFTDVDKICESPLTENIVNIAQPLNDEKDKVCTDECQKVTQDIQCQKICEQSEVKKVSDQVNVASCVYAKPIVKCISEEIDKINTKKEVQKGHNTCTLTTATDIHFNTSIDTQDWFINESELIQPEQVSVTKSKSTDDSNNVPKPDEDDTEKRSSSMTRLTPDDDTDVNCVKKRKVSNVPSKKFTCTEDEFDSFVARISQNEQQKSFYGFTNAEKSVAEAKSLYANKLLDNLKITDFPEQSVKSVMCPEQNEDSDAFSVVCAESLQTSDKILSNATTLSVNVFTNDVEDTELFAQSQTNVDNVGKENDSCGFPAASEKSVMSFETVLSTAKTLFSNESIDNTKDAEVILQPEVVKQKICETNNSCCSSTAGEKFIVSSDKSPKAKTSFVDKYIENVEIAQLTESQGDRDKIEVTDNPCGFSTASGKRIAPSDKALLKAKTFFANEITDNVEVPEAFVQPQEIGKKTEQIDDLIFSTANGKCIALSDKALSKAKRFLVDEFTDNVEVPELFVQPQEIERNTEQSGDPIFFTASGKCITLSDKALSKAKRLFVDEFTDNVDVPELFVQPQEIERNTEQSGDPIFSIASGKCITLSDKALSKAKRLFVDEFTDNVDVPELFVQPQEMKKKTEQISDAILSTASGKCTALSDKALSKAKEVFVDEFTDNVDVIPELFVQPLELKKKTEQISDPIFFTASGKCITLSDKALSKAKRLFVDEFTDNVDVPELFVQPQEIERNTEQSGDPIFSIASGKCITLSDKALSKAKRLFVDEFTDNVDVPELFVQPQEMKKKTEQISDAILSTASGKCTALSDKALSKAKEVFVDEFTDNVDVIPELFVQPLELEKKTEQISDPIFSTASGKCITLSDKALSKAKRLFVDEFTDNVDVPELFVQPQEIKRKIEQSGDPIFSTASGKCITLSDKALSKAKQLFGDEFASNDDALELFVQPQEMKEKIEGMNNLCGFSTASGKRIALSDEALSKAKTVFMDEITDNVEVPESLAQPQNIKEKIEEVDNPCFSTASGKYIALSDKALSKAKILFVDEFTENANVPESFAQAQEVKEKIEGMSNSFGFSTASGKHIALSDNALSKAKTLFVDEFMDNTDVPEIFVQPQEVKEKIEGIGNPFGFSTASGKHIGLCDKALSKAKTLFVDEFTDNTDVPEIFVQPQEVKEKIEGMGNPFGFSTASGKHIALSDKALSKAKTLFIDEISDNVEVPAAFPQPQEIKEKIEDIGDPCFSTASGKSIELSDKALLKAKTLFANDIPDNDESLEIFAQPLKKRKMIEKDPVNFTATSSQSMKISEKALSKRRNLFANKIEESSAQVPLENEFTDSIERLDLRGQRLRIKPCTERNSDSCGFSSANGKCIVPSDKALSKAKARFADDFLDDDGSPEVLAQPSKKSRTNDIDSVNFSTAKGQPMKASRKSLSKAKNLFADELDAFLETSEPQIINDNEKENVETFHLSTASGKPINISDKAIRKAQALFLNDLDNNLETQNLPDITSAIVSSNTDRGSAVLKDTPTNSEFNVVQKRKVRDSDDDTPLGRRSVPNSKKARFSDERQGRKLFSDDSHVTAEIQEQPLKCAVDESEQYSMGAKNIVNSVPDEDIKDRRKAVARSLSDEIAASASALLADESCDKNVGYWNSQATEKATENSLTASSCTSPVLGRPSTLQRRGKRKTATKANVPAAEQNIVSSKKKCRHSDGADSSEVPRLEAKGTLQKSATSGSVGSSEFEDTQLIMDYIDKATSISEKRLAAALEQDREIQAKRTSKPKRTTGALLLYKEANRNDRISWKKLTNGIAPVLRNYKETVDQNVSPEVLEITSKTAETYRFRCTDFYENGIVETNVHGLEMEDGARLILDENGYVGLSEINRAFMASPGIDPALLPAGWTKNHYRWIVWKLASMDRMKFVSVSLPRALTPARVMEQLKYRYNREIDRSQRSALRRILEKDDAAYKRMILCVSSLAECKNAEVVGKSPSIAVASYWKMVLTDGWYSVPACLDVSMINNISSGKIREGTKLLTYGAELLNSDQGCSPLEIPSDVCLKIHTNSTRRVKWHAKMGFAPCPGPISVKLRSVCAHGGLIGKMTVTVVRAYPLLYHEKTSTGESIFRNARCEEKANLAYEQECSSKMEALYAKTEEYFSIGKKRLSVDTDSMDFLAAELSEECQKLSEKEFMSEQQQEYLLRQCRVKEQEFRQKLESKLQENLPPQRKVSPVLKLRVADEEKCAILTVWSPSDDVIDMLKEGNRVLICSVTASGRRADELQLTAGRSTTFKLESKSVAAYPQRICTRLCSVVDPMFNPIYSELDTVGLIVSIENGPYGMKNFEAVNLACPRIHSSDYSYLSILFWQGVATYGYKEILTVGSFVACSNLEWRRATSASIPLVYCTERTTFTRNPRQIHLQKAIEELKTSIAEPNACIANCAEEIGAELQKKLIARSPGYITPNKDASNKPILNIASQRLTGQNLGTNNGLSVVNSRSSSIQKRLEKLRNYGEPPELSPIIINTRSTRISLDFRSPVGESKPSKPTLT